MSMKNLDQAVCASGSDAESSSAIRLIPKADADKAKNFSTKNISRAKKSKQMEHKRTRDGIISTEM